MVPLITVLVLANPEPGTAQFEADGVRIDVNISAHVYEWNVTNLTAYPITRVEVGQHQMYNHILPDGWHLEDADDRFRAWTDQPDQAIAPQQSRTFSARVSSAGAVLGMVSAVFHFEGAEAPVTVQVWGAVPEPIAKIVMIPVIIVLVAILHAWFGKAGQKERR